MNFAEYGDLLTQAYDIDKPEAPKADLDWHRAFITTEGEPVLAAMCGSGRSLVPLREAGVDIDGVDASPHMLAACRAKLAERDLHANIYEQKTPGPRPPAPLPVDLHRRRRLVRADPRRR